MGKPAEIKKTTFIIGCTVALFGIFVMLILAIIVNSYLNYRHNGNLSSNDSQSLVFITEPENASQFQAGSTIRIEVNAAGLQPFISTELWINGKLEGVHAVPPSGMISITTFYSWTPPEGGNYSLVARAIDRTNVVITSPAVVVFINTTDYDGQSDPEAGKSHTIVNPPPPVAYGQPEPPSPDISPEPAREWEGTPSNWVDSFSAGSVPTAPEIAVTSEGCIINVNLHDLSDDEEGFVLYRQTTNSPDWVHVANLASHPGTGWIEFKELSLSGGITYYAAAFNSEGESSSNLSLVNLEPQSCPPIEPTFPVPKFSLKVESVQISDAVDNLYCYSSVNGGHWSRWPEYGFITSKETGQVIPPLQYPVTFTSADKTEAHTLPKTMWLNLECWGWQGLKLIPLGGIADEILTAHPKEIVARFSGATIDFQPVFISDTKYKNFVLGTSLKREPLTVEEQIYSVDYLGYVPESDQMPPIQAAVTDRPNVCKSLMKDPADKEVYCSPLPGFVDGPGGSAPQMYLIWTVLDGYCEGFAEGKKCFTLSWWEKFAKYNPDPYNHGIHFIVRNRINASTNIDFPIDTYQQAWRIHPDYPPTGDDKCLAHYRWLEVFLEVESSAGKIRSAPSNLVVEPCPQPLGDTVDIEVNFYSMTLDNVDDGIDDVKADALHGWFGTSPAGKPEEIRMGYWEKAGECFTPFDVLERSEPIPCIDKGVGAFLLENEYLCSYVPYNPSDPNAISMCMYDSLYQPGNNKIVVTLRDQEPLQLFAYIAEYDNMSGDDTVCEFQGWVGPRSIEQWAGTSNEELWYYMEDNGDASCAVHVFLNALKP